MHCKINDQDVSCELLYFREFGYGTGHHVWQTVEYVLRVDAEDFCRYLASFYESYAWDDQMHGAPDEDEIVLQMRAAGWPSLSWLVKNNPVLLGDFVLRHAAYDAIQAIFTPYKKKPLYLIDSVDGVDVAEGVVRLCGRALRVPQEGGAA